MFTKGVIYGMHLAGESVADIADEVVKPDGCSPAKLAVREAISFVTARGGLHFDDCAKTHPGGRPRVTTTALDKKIMKTVFKHRGRAKVTTEFLQKVIPEARRICRRTLARRLEAAGMAWLRRRRKSLVTSQYKPARLSWVSWVKTRRASTLARWMYSDGTTFFLARTEADQEQKQRLSLGTNVWRMANGGDGLFEDCVGPSSYAKAQGIPVRMWGLLLKGTLFVYFLPKGEVMNRRRYAWLIEHKFPGWMEMGFGRRFTGTPFLLQDHERALWNEEPLNAVRESGISVLEKYPKCPQDLNPIEVVWRELRARLHQTQPTRMEQREDFIARVRHAVAWVNKNRADYLKYLCTCQKEWARNVDNARGSRTKH